MRLFKLCPLLLLGLLGFVGPAFAQASQPLDEQINAIVSPPLDFISGLVFTTVPLMGAQVPLIVIWLLIGAIFLTLRMSFINVRGFTQAIRIAKGTYDNPHDPGEVTHFQALTAALSGTVGLGNIAGVAIAISIGGPGATVWMIIAGLLGMSSKFTECALGVYYRHIDKNGVVAGGPMRYLSTGLAERGMGRFGKFLSYFFAVLCIGGTLGSGCLFQVNQATQQFTSIIVPVTGGESSVFNSPLIFGTAYALLAALIVIGGIKSIARVTSKLVPLMALIYMAAALAVLSVHLDQIPAAFEAIFAGAFTSHAGIGGVIGVMVQGLRRATFSNEAGIGSAAIAHSAAKTKEPIAEGMVALLEPFIDTVVICTTTALVIIVTGVYQNPDAADGITLTSQAFGSVLSWFPNILTIAVVLFAFSTSITWFYYGEKAFGYLVGDRPKAVLGYKIAYILALIVGSSMTLSSVMNFADAMILVMAFPNMIGLYILSGHVRRMLDSYIERLKAGEIKPYTEAETESAAAK